MKHATTRGSLYFVAVVLGVSAVMRVGLYADDALALVEQVSASQPSLETETTCEPTYDIAAVLSAFDVRDADLAEREANVAQSETALRLIKEKIEDQMNELAAAETRLSELISQSHSASKNDLEKLSAVYSAMNPKQAAALFETMDPQFAAGFLGLLDPFVAAEILAGVTPEKAYALSVIVAGRNVNAPTE
ncbi:hypothetical protein N9A67_03435 [Rhodobacteraceae bacterium]|nr:hypothetical protein [Paracoccaceae bacterium]